VSFVDFVIFTTCGELKGFIAWVAYVKAIIGDRIVGEREETSEKQNWEFVGKKKGARHVVGLVVQPLEST